jgi:HTH-type transcriptional repressor of NAD biosynthesis genes
MHFILTGTESTYKTAIATQLAADLDVNYVSEFARDYLSDKTDLIDFNDFPRSHFKAIVQGQLSQELAHHYHDPLALTRVFDTDRITLEVWNREVWNASIAESQTIYSHNIYLLCAPTTPWVDEGMRVDGHRREALHRSYIDVLEELEATYHILDAPDFNTRLQQAKDVVKKFRITRRDSAAR